VACSREGKQYLCSAPIVVRLLCKQYNTATGEVDQSTAQLTTTKARILSIIQRLSLSSKTASLLVDVVRCFLVCTTHGSISVLFLILSQGFVEEVANQIAAFATHDVNAQPTFRDSMLASLLTTFINVLCACGQSDVVSNLISDAIAIQVAEALLHFVSEEGAAKEWLRSAALQALYLLAASPFGRNAIASGTSASATLKACKATSKVMNVFAQRATTSSPNFLPPRTVLLCRLSHEHSQRFCADLASLTPRIIF